MLKDDRVSIEKKEISFNKLERIKIRLITNVQIITKAFLTKDDSLFYGLIGWNAESLKWLKARLRDINLEWCAGLNEIIPKEKYGKNLSTQRFNELLEKLKM
jgi:hypothetical protein